MRCRKTAMVTLPLARELPPAIEATNPLEIERAIFARRLSAFGRFAVEIIIRSSIAASVRDALIEHRAVENVRRSG